MSDDPEWGEALNTEFSTFWTKETNMSKFTAWVKANPLRFAACAFGLAIVAGLIGTLLS